MKRASWNASPAASSRQTSFRSFSRRSRIGKLLSFPLLKIENDQAQMQLEVARPRRLRTELHRVDNNGVAEALELVQERQQCRQATSAIQLHRTDLLA